MNVSGIISLFRSRCHNVSTSELSDAQALEFANMGYQRVVATIRSSVNEDFMSDVWTRDLVIGQTEYSFDTRGDDSSLVAPIKKITKVAVKLKSTSDYVLAQSIPTSELPYDETLMATYVTDPMYRVADLSLFLYPTPTEVVTAGLKVYGLYDPIPLTLATVEANIGVPPSHHDMITSHMRYLYYENIKQLNERSVAYNDMLQDEARMVTQLSNRVTGQQNYIMPNVSVFS